MSWANIKQTPDDLQQLFTLTGSLKGKNSENSLHYETVGWKVEYCLNLSPPLRSISLPQPASSSQTDIISHIQIASVCSGRGSWLPFLSSVEIDFSQLSQPAFFWNLCKIYIYKK